MAKYQIRCPSCGLIVGVSSDFLVEKHLKEKVACDFRRGRPGYIRSLHAELAYEIHQVRTENGFPALPRVKTASASSLKVKKKKKKNYPFSNSYSDRTGSSWREVSGGSPSLGKNN